MVNITFGGRNDDAVREPDTRRTDMSVKFWTAGLLPVFKTVNLNDHVQAHVGLRLEHQSRIRTYIVW